MTSQFSILNKILSTKDISLITLNNLDDKYFFNYKNEFNFIKSHYEEYRVVPDKITFANRFPEFDFVEVTEPDSYLLEQLYNDYSDSYIINNFNTIKKLFESGQDEKAREFYKRGLESYKTNKVMTCIDLLKDTDDRLAAYLERAEDFSKFYVSTGFEELDRVIGGWDRKEEYGLIVARTNTGKSYVAIKMAVAASQQGLNVGYYSGEMTSRKVGYRLDTILGHISNGSLIHGNGNVHMEYEQYLKTLPLAKGSFKVLTPLDINGPATVDALRTFIEREHLDILFVDQISLLEDQRYGKSTIEKTANISKDLKNLQVMSQIPIIAVAQQNRTKNEDGSQDTTQIAQSDRLGQDCTVAIFLDKDKEDLMRFTLVKSRDSQNGVILNYHVDFNRGTWTYVPNEKDSLTTDEDYETLEESFEVTSSDGVF